VNFSAFWNSLHHIGETFIGRLPSLAIAVVVFICFYVMSKLVARVIRRATRGNRQNLGVVFARLIGAAVVMLLVGFIAGWTTLDRRIRQKYGGLKIY